MKSRIIEIAAWTNQYDSETVRVCVTRKSETGFPNRTYHLDYKQAERLADRLVLLKGTIGNISFRPFLSGGCIGYVLERRVNQ